ncbi:MAG: outer membrane protein assembly factor BamB family protein, partial [Alphaproteobacteria bacterium]
ELENLRKRGKEETREFAELKQQSDAFHKDLKPQVTRLDEMKKQVTELNEQIKAARAKPVDTDAILRPAIKWRRALPNPEASGRGADSMILAAHEPGEQAGVLFVGGKDRVFAFDADTGNSVWTAQVEGKAVGLAAANGCLFVSTDKGRLHCFGEAAPLSSGVAQRAEQPVNPSPYAQDELTRLYSRAARRIVQETNITKGYCLVLGCGIGRLAFELAKLTELKIYGVEADDKKVETARKQLDGAGLYGVRVTVEQGTLSELAYADYFANLIVCDDMLVSGRTPGSAREAYRCLKPCGGVMFVGQTAEATRSGRRLTARDLARWMTEGGIAKFEITEREGLPAVPTTSGAQAEIWAKVERGPLPGAGSWTHQYANPANTTCSDDQLVRCPLNVLWFGKPGPLKMVNRHASVVAPLAVSGRLFVQGRNVIMALDSYNGVTLWEREIAGVTRTRAHKYGSNMAARAESLFVAVRDKCLRLDAATGKTLATYILPACASQADRPPEADAKGRRWGYVACVGDLLYGTSVPDCIFARDIETGKLVWAHRGKKIRDITISIGDGRMFFAESGVTAGQRQEALRDKRQQLLEAKGADADATETKLKSADVRLVVALDAASGQELWQRSVDLTDCGGDALCCSIYDSGVLLFLGAHHNSHYWHLFRAGDPKYVNRRITALSAADGALLWSRPLGYRLRPLVVNGVIYGEPHAFDLRTGEQVMRAHPLTGKEVPFEFGPSGGCAAPSACPNCMFFRCGTIAYHDFIRDHGTTFFGAMRPGCWISMIPANGLLLYPEASSGCVCLYAIASTIVFKPSGVDRAWARFNCRGALTPVKHLAVNLGAPGDRRDRDGTLWLGYPRPGGLALKLGVDILPGGGYFNIRPEEVKIEGTNKPWVFASGCRGLTFCSVPLVGKGQEPGVYTVRLLFADCASANPGQRVFHVRLQDEIVLKDLDIVNEAGGPSRALVKEFKGIEVEGRLEIGLIPKATEPIRRIGMPLISGIEAIRTKPGTGVKP